MGYADHFKKLEVEFRFKTHNSNRPDSFDLNDVDDASSRAPIYLWDPDGIRIEPCAWLPA